MKKKWSIIPLFLCMALSAHTEVSAASAYAFDEEETAEGRLHKMTFSERFDGRITESDLTGEMEYGGILYELYEADFTYQYVSDPEEIPGNIRTEIYALTDGETAEIPKYMGDGDIVYVLKEESMIITPTAYGQASGADTVYTTVKMQKLPDNDMEQIPVTIEKDGHTWELLYADFAVSDHDKNGAPSEYEAECTYGRLNGYSVTQETAWQAAAQYQGYRANRYVIATDAVITYAYLETAEEETEAIWEASIEAEMPKAESKKLPALEELSEPEKQSALEELPEPERLLVLEEISDPFTGYVIAAAVVSGGGIFAMAWYLFLMVPIYAMTAKGTYKKIGRIRLRKEKEYYAANLSDRIIRKAQVPSFMIRVPGKVRKVMKINSRDGSNLIPVIDRKVTFGLNDQ